MWNKQAKQQNNETKNRKAEEKATRVTFANKGNNFGKKELKKVEI